MNEEMGAEKKRKLPTAILSVSVIVVVVSVLHEGVLSDAITAFMCVFASTSVGAVVGFLFGIPITKQQVRSQDRNSALSESDRRANQPSYLANTHLEEVSDWLTKIIVGVGLVEFKTMGGGLADLARMIAGSMSKGVDHAPFILALIVFYLVVGFFMGFLSTRLYLASKFSEADREIMKMREDVADVLDVVREIQEHSVADSHVAQADFYRRMAEADECSLPRKKEFLERSRLILEIARRIQPNNIPAHIGLAKYYARSNEFSRAKDLLIGFKAKLGSIKPETRARLDYNIACYAFREAKQLEAGSEERAILAQQSFDFLCDAISEESLYRDFAELDEDWHTDSAVEKAMLSKVKSTCSTSEGSSGFAPRDGRRLA